MNDHAVKARRFWNCTTASGRCSCQPGTKDRRGCWPGWGSGPWPPPAAGLPPPWSAGRVGDPGRGAGSCRRDRAGNRASGVGGPGERLRRRPGRDRRDAAGLEAAAVLGGGRHRRPGHPDLRAAGGRAGLRPRPRPPPGTGAPGPHGTGQNHLHGRPDLADTIAPPQAYQDAGADALCPGPHPSGGDPPAVASVDRPVNVLARPGCLGRRAAAAGVGRVSAGGAFAFAAVGAVVEAATELREAGVRVLAACPRRPDATKSARAETSPPDAVSGDPGPKL